MPSKGNIPEEANALLGILNDVEIAKQFDLSVSRVRRYRHTLQIPPVKQRAWTALEWTRLNNPKLSDSKVAYLLGCSENNVWKIRRRIGGVFLNRRRNPTSGSSLAASSHHRNEDTGDQSR